MSKWKHPYKIGGKRSRLYSTWINMKQRCTNPNDKNYKNYGGRGIMVCDEWLSYDNFYEWAVSQGFDESVDRKFQSIDRIDVNKGYSPDNCRIATMLIQGRNRRNNVILNGKCISQIADEAGIDDSTFRYRLKKVKNVEKAILGNTACEIRKYEHIIIDGHTLRELSEIYGVDYWLICNRARKGERSLDRLIDSINKGYKQKILIEGKTFRELSSISGISIKTIRQRYYKQGLTTVADLTRPVKGKA